MAEPHYHVRDQIDGIIGVDFLASQLMPGLRRNPLELLARNTKFGWIVFGGLAADNKPDTLATINLVTSGELYAQIRRLCEIEEVTESPVMSEEDSACEALYSTTVMRQNGRYAVTLLMKPDSELGESRAMARRRLYCLENRFEKNPDLKEAYIKFMNEYEELGHMKRAEPLQPNAMHYYIPHHAVAIDRKFRVVFDASAKTTNGKSLNDKQYVGPRLQKDLIDIVMNFRTGRFAITADICKMFRQVQVQPKYWDLQRILWRKTKKVKDPIGEYWVTVVTYGMVSSPYNAVKTLKQCALDNTTEFPRAARTVKSDFYMHDLLTSVETEIEAITLKGDRQHQVIDL